jgi:Ca-activated chloride channel family protein
MRKSSLSLFVAISISNATLASGQGFILPQDQIAAPRLTSHQVKVDINNQAAEIHVRQVFRNNAQLAVEGIYYFPVPREATVSNFAMWADGKKLTGELLNREQARKIYEDIVRRNVDPALLEYADHSFFRVNIFPIPPGKEREIELDYSQLLALNDGLVRFLYPLHGESQLGSAQSRRFMPMPARTMPDDSAASESKPNSAGPSGPACKETFVLNIKSDASIKNVYSPSHKVEIDRLSNNDVRVSYEGSRKADEGDLLLYYSLSTEELGLGMICHKTNKEEGFFMLLISPQTQLAEKKILDKDLVFVLDTSGSMAGEKLQQAKSSLEYCINQVRANDRFALLTFSSEVQQFNASFVQGNEEKHKALDFVRRLDARGGTNIDEALKQALSFQGDGQRPLSIVFLTDGVPTVGATDIKTILGNVKNREEGGDDVASRNQVETPGDVKTHSRSSSHRNRPVPARIFTFGIGYDVNTYLLDKIADQSHAAADYIAPQENIEEKISAFFDKINRPVLSNLSLDVEGITVTDVYPKNLPDLFQGSQLMVLGRYKNAGRSMVTLKGRASNGTVDYSYGCEFADDAQNDFLPRLWASRKIAYLVDEMRTNGENEEVRKEIEKLSKEYGIMSPYTSYLVQEDQAASSAQQVYGGRGRGKEGGVSFLRVGNGSPAPMMLFSDASASVGQLAVERSKDLQEMKKAERINGELQPDVRYVGGKMFYLHDGEWADSRYQGENVVEIKHRSAAFINLLISYPELGKYMNLGNRMLIELNGKFIKIGDQGDDSSSAEKLRQIFG